MCVSGAGGWFQVVLRAPKKIKQVRGQDDRVEGADARLEG